MDGKLFQRMRLWLSFKSKYSSWCSRVRRDTCIITKAIHTWGRKQFLAQRQWDRMPWEGHSFRRPEVWSSMLCHWRSLCPWDSKKKKKNSPSSYYTTKMVFLKGYLFLMISGFLTKLFLENQKSNPELHFLIQTLIWSIPISIFEN